MLEILQEQFALPPYLFGALIIFAIVNTLVPGFLLKVAVAEFETPTAPREPVAKQAHDTTRGDNP